MSIGKPLLMAAAVAAAAALTVVGILVAKHGIGSAGTGATGVAGPAAGQFIYTARTANDAAVTLPGAVQNELLRFGEEHRSIELTRVGFNGKVSTFPIDLTPRTGNSSTDHVLVVHGRAIPAIDAKISGIENAINTSYATTGGGRALYAGLEKTNFTSAPVTIISSGLDLANPDNFRALNWSVPPEEVAANAKKAGDLPALHGPVTFVLVPTAGRQPQLGQTQKNYVKAVWTALLTAGGATSVKFINANGAAPGSRAPIAATVPVPNQVVTPVTPVPTGPGTVTCAVPASYFVVNTPQLLDPARTTRDLARCIKSALADHASFALDGWTSYEGPLNANGQPAINYAVNRTLSKARVATIAQLMVNRLEVPRSAITRMTGHGDFHQPFPDPGSPANRVVKITYTVR